MLRLANAVLSVGGTLALLVFAYYCFRYAPSVDDQLLTPADTMWGYIVVGAVPVVLLSSLLLRPAPKIAVAGFVVCGAVALYAAEIVLNLVGGMRSEPMWSTATASAEARTAFAALGRAAGVEVDARDRLQVLDEMRARGVGAVPAIMLADILLGEDGLAPAAESGDAAELLPLGGISRSATVLCNELGPYVIYQSDQYGFRNPPAVWTAPRADVAAIGQSLTQGYCVPDGSGFVDLLRTQYPATLNLGVSGESALLQLAAIKEYLVPYAPKVVLWFFYEGQDLHTLYEESTHPLVMRYLEPTFVQHLATRQPEIDRVLRTFVSGREANHRHQTAGSAAPSFTERASGILKLWRLRENFHAAYGIRTDDAEAWFKLQELAQNLLSDALVQSNALTRSWGGTLYFVYLPSWNRYQNGPAAAERDRKRVLNLVSTLGIPTIDVEAAFAAQPDPLSLFPFRRFGHYNEAGNRIVADALLRQLAAHDRSDPSGTHPQSSPAPLK